MPELERNPIGLKPDKQVRYAIVGLGDIAQEDMIPGIRHTGNSVATAVISSHPRKAREVANRYQVEAVYTYEQFDEALLSESFDAIYLATPNWRHAEFIEPALKAGVHVLTEKPLEVSTKKCEGILEAEKDSPAKLMVGYRLHFEPGTLDTVEKVRSGQLGEVHLFASTFTQLVDPANHRGHSGENGGPIFDMGPYPVNAARYIFGDEPNEVISATGTKHSGTGFDRNFYDTAAVTLGFPGGRLAQFNVSYFGHSEDSFIAVGTKGSVRLDPSYTFGKPLVQTVSIDGKNSTRTLPNTDHFGGEMAYFSDCILNDKEPEPNGEEGFADVRVLEAILTAFDTRSAVRLESFRRKRRIDTEAQKMMLSAVSTPDLVKASNPARGMEKQAKN